MITNWRELVIAYQNPEDHTGLDGFDVTTLEHCKAIWKASEGEQYSQIIYPVIGRKLDGLIKGHRDREEKARPESNAERRHQETIGVAKQANCLASWAIVVSIVALVVSAAAAFCGGCWNTSSQTQLSGKQQLISKSHPMTSSSYESSISLTNIPPTDRQTSQPQ